MHGYGVRLRLANGICKAAEHCTHHNVEGTAAFKKIPFFLLPPPSSSFLLLLPPSPFLSSMCTVFLRSSILKGTQCLVYLAVLYRRLLLLETGYYQPLLTSLEFFHQYEYLRYTHFNDLKLCPLLVWALREHAKHRFSSFFNPFVFGHGCVG